SKSENMGKVPTEMELILEYTQQGISHEVSWECLKHFIPNTIDENMQKIIKEQVKEQVKVQVFKILPKIEQTVNEQLEAEVLTQSSNSSKTSYAVAADLSEMEIKKILIEKIEGNKSNDLMNKGTFTRPLSKHMNPIRSS
nr:hypothetical protein [Tanacetum cinerariifolium]